MKLSAHCNDSGQYQIYVCGEWIDCRAEALYPNLDPAHRRTVLGQVAETPVHEVNRAVRAAAEAFPGWRTVSGNLKTKAFLQLAQVLYRRYDEIIALMTREMGKTLFDCRLDLDEAIGVVECVAPQGLSLKGETYQKNVEGIVMESRREPRGVAAIITPFNFPVAIPLAQVVAALVTGNTVVWKPSHLIPETSQCIVDSILEAFSWLEGRSGVGLPAGALNMVTGDAACGSALATHPLVQCLSFTGSKAVGDRVSADAAARGIRVMKEVGGINTFYVHRDADIARAARNFIYGKTITAGQRCTSIQEVHCDAAVYDRFVAAAIAEAAGVVAGPGDSPEIAEADATPGRYSLPPLVSEEQQVRVRRLVDEAVSAGATVRYRVDLSSELADEGFYYPLTVLENVGDDNVASNTEIFGPVAVIRRVKNIDEAIAITNRKIGIVGCIDSRSKDATEYFIQNVLRTRVDDGRHGTGAFWATRFGGDRGAGSGSPALDENMVDGYLFWKTIYRTYDTARATALEGNAE